MFTWRGELFLLGSAEFSLTVRAEKSRSSSEPDFSDGGAAVGARLSCLTVDAKFDLEVASFTRGVDEVADGGAAAGDGLMQGFAQLLQ